MLRVSVLLALLKLAHAANDPKIFDVKQITTFGDNAYPMFSPDSRFILFQSKGQEYGTSCSRIYQIDLNNLKSEPISLFSTGIGDEFRPILYDWFNYFDNSFVSTSTHWLKKLYADKNQKITPDSFCGTKSRCDSPTDSTLQQACTTGILDYTEHQDYTSVIQFNYDGILHNTLKFASDNQLEWMNPMVVIGANKEVRSGSCILGECIMTNNTVVDATPFNKIGAAYDGFSFNPFYDENKSEYFFFHGYDAPEIWQQTAIRKGVTPTANSKIYRTTYEFLEMGIEPERLVDPSDKKTYLWPQPTKDNKKVIATGIDPDTKKAGIYLLELNKASILLSDPTVNTYHAILDPTNKYIAFVSDRDGKSNIYMGKYLDSNIVDPSYNPTPPVMNSDSLGKPIKNYYSYGNPSKKNTLYNYRRAKFSDSGKMIFTGRPGYTDCPQVYIYDMDKNDTGVHRKISSGFHVYNSPNFIKDSENVLFGSTLTHNYTDGMEMTDCREHVCTPYIHSNNKGKVENLCTNVVKEKGLPSDMELYISNKYGVIQQRLTFNDGFDGEAVTSPDGKTLVYSSVTNDDYELYQMNIDGTGQKKLTNAVGFEGDVTFSPDGKLIAYYATRPSTSDEKNTYKQMKAYDFTDIGRTQIFVYSFETGKEYQLTNLNKISLHSPAFMEKGSDKWSYRLVFLADNGKKPGNGDYKSDQYLYGALFNSPKDSKLDKRIVSINKIGNSSLDLIWDLNVHGDSLVFAKLGDLCIMEKFDPDFSHSGALTVKVPGSILLLAALISKFL